MGLSWAGLPPECMASPLRRGRMPLCRGGQPLAPVVLGRPSLPRNLRVVGIAFSSSTRPRGHHSRSAPRAISRTGELSAETTVCPPRYESPAVPPKPRNTKPQPASKARLQTPLLPVLFVPRSWGSGSVGPARAQVQQHSATQHATCDTQLTLSPLCR